VAATALEARLPDLLAKAPPAVRLAAISAAGSLGIRSAAPQLARIAGSLSDSPAIRSASLDALSSLDPTRLATAVEKAVNDSSNLLRKNAVKHLGALSPDKALNALRTVLVRGSVGERQNAFAVLAKLPGQGASAILREWLDRVLSGAASPELHLDILEAAEQRQEPEIRKRLQAYHSGLPQDDEVAPFKPALHGGDAEAGLKVFQEKIEVSCQRCHRLDGRGGDVGPSVDGIGAKHPRLYLLESIVAPSRKIAEGFASVSVELGNGDEYSGTVRKETDAELQLNLADGSVAKIDKSQIILKQTSSLSGMPPGMGQILTKRELRDLVEFLAQRK